MVPDLDYRLIWEARQGSEGHWLSSAAEALLGTVPVNLFQPIDPMDSVPLSLRRFLQVRCGWQEAEALADRLEGSSATVPGSVEVLGPILPSQTAAPVAAPVLPMLPAAGPVPRLSQGHLDDPRTGIRAPFAWSYHGGRGEGVQVVDVEQGWLLDHEALVRDGGIAKLTPVTGGGEPHGTAVLGVLCGQGRIRGVVPAADPAVAQVRDGDEPMNACNVLRLAIQRARPPAVVLVEVELSTRYPRMGFQLPLEVVRAARMAIRATAREGVYVVMAAGNGRQNLGSWSLDRRRFGIESGAIVVGAAKPGDNVIAENSNHGHRVDLSAWGSDITTCDGSPDHADPPRSYREDFGGTSGAAAIVAGAIASIAGIVHAAGADPLSSKEMNQLLTRTGRLWVSHLGPRPNLRAAVRSLHLFRVKPRKRSGIPPVHGEPPVQ